MDTYFKLTKEQEKKQEAEYQAKEKATREFERRRTLNPVLQNLEILKGTIDHRMPYDCERGGTNAIHGSLNRLENEIKAYIEREVKKA